MKEKCTLRPAHSQHRLPDMNPECRSPQDWRVIFSTNSAVIQGHTEVEAHDCSLAAGCRQRCKADRIEASKFARWY